MWTLDQVSLQYRRDGAVVHALRDITVTLGAERSLAITGTSGSGKSSLLSLLGALQSPSGGKLQYQGRSLHAMSLTEQCTFRAQSVGFVFQHFCLLPHLSMLENVLLGVDHLARDAHADAKARALDSMEKLGVVDLWNRRPHEVSGGQAQRVAIARAVLREPAWILADEPTGSLDDESAVAVMDALQTVSDSRRGLILVTHNASIAARMDARLHLCDGRVADTM